YLLQGLAAYPVRLTLANLSPGDPGEAAVEALGIPVERIPPSRWKVDRIARLAVWLRRERPLLVHSWSFFGNTYTAWAGAAAGVPLRLGCLRGDAFYDFTRPGQAPPLFMRLGLETPHAVVANSTAAAAAIEERGPRRARMRVVHNGLDLAALRAAAFSPLTTHHSPLTTPVLALVGSMIPRKNVPMFLRVIRRLSGRYPAIEGWLIGEGPERAAVEALAGEMGVTKHVRFWGRQANVPRLLTGVEVLCHCAHSEGLSNAIMEASALGLPVVVTRSGGTAEIVEDGVTGFTVDLDDDAAMASHVGRLLADTDLRMAMGEAGRRKMEREFSLERMVRDMTAVYHGLLGDRGAEAFGRSGVRAFEPEVEGLNA
ncbi:MAG: glycosyltransferase family 4 protein, partial [Dehalococcoidia bacterium]